jgi:hypothetical protein
MKKRTLKKQASCQRRVAKEDIQTALGRSARFFSLYRQNSFSPLLIRRTRNRVLLSHFSIMRIVIAHHWLALYPHVYAVRPHKDKRGLDRISDALPFGLESR